MQIDKDNNIIVLKYFLYLRDFLLKNNKINSNETSIAFPYKSGIWTITKGDESKIRRK